MKHDVTEEELKGIFDKDSYNATVSRLELVLKKKLVLHFIVQLTFTVLTIFLFVLFFVQVTEIDAFLILSIYVILGILTGFEFKYRKDREWYKKELNYIRHIHNIQGISSDSLKRALKSGYKMGYTVAARDFNGVYDEEAIEKYLEKLDD